MKPVTFIARLPLMPALDPIFDRTAERSTKLTNARLSPDHLLFKTPPHLLPQERSHPTGDFVSRPLTRASSEAISPAGRGRQIGGFDASAHPVGTSEMHGKSDYLSQGQWNSATISCVAASIFSNRPQQSVTSMRAKTSNLLFTSVLKLLSHAMMGIAVGLAFAFVLTRFDPLGLMSQINNGADPGITPAILSGIIVLSFALGATLTGLIFMLTEDR